MKEKNAISIYIHIPFCESKCIYCAFTSFCASKEDKERYVEFLLKEIEKRKVKNPIQSIYIGGGTPSVLTTRQIEKILNCVKVNYKILDNAEVTIEVNPNSIDEEKLKDYKNMGINRLSVGVQSLNNNSLKKIGRLHSKKQALHALKLARKYFDNISADLILGLQGEKFKKVKRHVKTLIKNKINHISCYMLEVQTPNFSNLIAQKKYLPLDDDTVAKVYEKLVKFLRKKGYTQYEISNFAKDGKLSQHNLNYWKVGQYLGFGVSAHSYYNNIRFYNSDNFEQYYAGDVSQETQTSKTLAEEIIMLGLRCCLGVDLKNLQKLGYDVSKNAYFEDYVHKQILYIKDGKMFLNPKFYAVSNIIISNLIDLVGI